MWSTAECGQCTLDSLQILPFKGRSIRQFIHMLKYEIPVVENNVCRLKLHWLAELHN